MKINEFPKSVFIAACKFGLLKPQLKFNFKKITDGVSSDIWYVKTENNKEFCIKRALNKLTVKEDWYAPVDRSNFEVYYFKACKKIIPESFPKILGHDKKKYILAMEWYEANDFKVWKEKLLNKEININDAKKISDILVKKHNYFYNNSHYKKKFENSKTFYSIRIEPYLIFTSKNYPEQSKKFIDAANSLSLHKKTIIHGDFSPKNILISKDYPVILDAETACWGDPVFDLAFCNNHIILKSILHNKYKKNYMLLSQKLIKNYIQQIKWENKNDFIQRFLKLLPLLMLARLDGKSPVEYFKDNHKNKSRLLALSLIRNELKSINEFFTLWKNV